MAKINLLDRSVFELIAAGEVIERPASVIKELAENAIDAGARHITVEIKNGGSTYMRVTDDGSGMPFEEVPTAFLRHATSKVRTAEDLDRIFTLGFRGEALASIAAVSKVEVLTKEPDGKMGTSLKISGGDVVEHEETGCPDGTTFIVRDLFYNVPARQKFLKKDVTEGNQIQALTDKLALAHPDIAFRFIRDNKLIRDTSGSGDYFAAVYAVFGKQFALSLIPVDFSLNGITVTGFISSPLFTRSNRALQYFFVNGRNVRSLTLMTALEEGFRNSIMTGKFPACVLNVGLSPELLDVNVSPSKTEVRFAYEKNVFDAVHFAVKNAILNADSGREVKLNPAKPDIPEKKPDIRPSSSIIADKVSVAIEKAVIAEEKTDKPEQSENNGERMRLFSIEKEPVYLRSEIRPLETVKQETAFVQERFSEPKPFYTPKPNVIAEYDEDEVQEEKSEEKTFRYISQQAVEAPAPREPEAVEEKLLVRVIGEVFKTYIVCEAGDEMLLIDKHAAHERINFERMRKELLTSSQLLAESEFVTLSVGQYNAIQENKELLDSIGFDVILSDGTTAEITASPSAFSGGNVPPSDILIRAAELLEKGNTEVIEEIYGELHHSKACKAAIKANDINDIRELQALVDEVMRDERIRFCPHGRPVMIKLSKREIEKYFSRIV